MKKEMSELDNLKAGSVIPNLHGVKGKLTKKQIRYMKFFENSTGKNAILHGKSTGQFEYWAIYGYVMDIIDEKDKEIDELQGKLADVKTLVAQIKSMME